MIAVITPVYNGAETIIKSIQSLLVQTYTDWLAIIVNDGSTDSTTELLCAFENDPRFRIINIPQNKGRGAARNIGLKEALESGATYMCMLDADDEYRADKLEMQANFMDAHPNITLCSSSIGLINHTGMYRILESSAAYLDLYYKDYFSMVSVPHASSIIRLSDVDVTFNESMRYSEDQDFLRRLLFKKRYCFIPEILYYYYRDASFSTDKYKQSLVATYESFRQLPITRKNLARLWITSSFKFLVYVILRIFRSEHIYFNRIGRIPTAEEICKFKNNEVLLRQKFR